MRVTGTGVQHPLAFEVENQLGSKPLQTMSVEGIKIWKENKLQLDDPQKNPKQNQIPSVFAQWKLLSWGHHYKTQFVGSHSCSDIMYCMFLCAFTVGVEKVSA